MQQTKSMKLYCNLKGNELKKYILGSTITYLTILIPFVFFANNLFIPFTEATFEYATFTAKDGYIDRFLTIYQADLLESNLDLKSMALFLVLQLIGAVMIPVLVFALYMIVVPQSALFILGKLNIMPKQSLKISRKPFTNES